MDEYITKSDAINIIKQRQDYLSSCDCWAIMNIPAADVAPVIHGKWHDVYMTSPSSFAATCSICGMSNDIPHPISAHYCPYCGAKMDGTKNE